MQSERKMRRKFISCIRDEGKRDTLFLAKETEFEICSLVDEGRSDGCCKVGLGRKTRSCACLSGNWSLSHTVRQRHVSPQHLYPRCIFPRVRAVVSTILCLHDTISQVFHGLRHILNVRCITDTTSHLANGNAGVLLRHQLYEMEDNDVECKLWRNAQAWHPLRCTNQSLRGQRGLKKEAWGHSSSFGT